MIAPEWSTAADAAATSADTVRRIVLAAMAEDRRRLVTPEDALALVGVAPPPLRRPLLSAMKHHFIPNNVGTASINLQYRCFSDLRNHLLY